MKARLLFIMLCLLGTGVRAQQKNWDTYSKNMSGGTSDIRVNNTLYDLGPQSEFQYLVKVTHNYTGAKDSKLPTKTEAANLVKIQDATCKSLNGRTGTYLAGSASHNKVCDMYFYVKDTTGLRAFINSQYKAKRYGRYNVDIKPDGKWSEYYAVLYPDEQQRQMIYYRRVVANLLRNGDKLKKPRKVTHWVYFKNEEDMRTCEARLLNKNYTIVAADKKSLSRYQVSFYHVTPITSEAILGAIQDIKGDVVANTGAYGGWQTIIRH